MTALPRVLGWLTLLLIIWLPVAWPIDVVIQRQVAQVFQPGPAQFNLVPAVVKPADGKPKQDPDDPFPRSASLQIDPDIDRLMARAQDFTGQGKYEVAVALWQKVLDGSGATLMTKQDGLDEERWIYRDVIYNQVMLQVYRSVRPEVEKLLGQLPKEGLMEYRITADAEARGLMAAAHDDRELTNLAEVVRRFFVSSVGDDAAFRLACLRIDRHDFIGASHLLEKILSVYPDSDIPRAEILLRLAVCDARIGDLEGVDAVRFELKELEKNGSLGVSPVALRLVRADLEKARSPAYQSADADGNWLTAHGNQARSGYMKSMAAAEFDSVLDDSWYYQVKGAFGSDETRLMKSTTTTNAGPQMIVMGGFGGRMNSYGTTSATVNSLISRDALVSKWKELGWRPTSRALLHDGKIIFHTYSRLICLDATGGDDGQPVLNWISPGSDATSGSDEDVKLLSEKVEQWHLQTNQMGRYGAASSNRNRPNDFRGVSLFGDHTLQSMAIANGMVYYIDGSPQRRNTMASAMMARFGMPAAAAKSPKSVLTAVEISSGKRKWMWPTEEDKDEKAAEQFRFLAAPVSHGGLLIAPVYSGRGLWLYAIRPTKTPGSDYWKASLAWKTSLCDEPESEGNRWGTVGMAIEGNELYVASGRGVVFAVDAGSGSIRWATRYQRNIISSTVRNRWGQVTGSTAIEEGWEENFIVVRGRTVVVMPTDYDGIWLLDRRFGTILGRNVRLGATYYMGTHGDRLVVGGRNSVSCLSINKHSGSLLWSVPLDDHPQPSGYSGSYGRGVVTEDAVYVPVKDSILKLALEKREQGQRLKQVIVRLPDEDDPVGNLMTDGQTMFVLGPERVYAVQNYQLRLRRLDRRIAAGETSLRARRIVLRARAGMLQRAAEDLQLLAADLAKSNGRVAAAVQVAQLMQRIDLPSRSPRDALKLLAGAGGIIPGLSQQERRQVSQAGSIQVVLSRTFETIAQKKIKGLTPGLLAAMAVWPDDARSTVAMRALVATSSAEDVRLIEKAIDSPSVPLQVAAIGALARIVGDRSHDRIAALLGAKDERVRIAAARAIGDGGDRRCLPALIGLLDSERFETRLLAIRMLRGLTGEKHNFLAHAAGEERKVAVARWGQWLAASAKTVKLVFPIKLAPYTIGRILITEAGYGRAIELGPGGVVKWTSPPVRGALACEGLPNGHRLISSSSERAVYEFDAAGKPVWKTQAALSIVPRIVQRLENGNTLVAGEIQGNPKRSKILEIGRDGKPIDSREISLPERIADARRLPQGTTLLALSSPGLVVELDASGMPIASTLIKNLNDPRSARRLANGNTLVCVHTITAAKNADIRGRRVAVRVGQVIEFDKNGEVVWAKRDGLSEVRDAQRLDSGNTLILDREQIREFDLTGTEVWSKKITNGWRISAY